MSQYALRKVLVLVLFVLFDICSGTALKYLVGGNVLQQNNDFIISNPFSRQVRYYNERPVYRPPVAQVEYANSPPLLIGNYAEPLYQSGYRASAQTPPQAFLATGYEQDFQPAGFQSYQDSPYPPNFYEDSYMPQDSHYGPPKPESKPEPPTTTVVPVMVATPCTCHPLTPSQPLPEGAPEDMYLPPEMTVAPETEEPTTPEPSTTTTEAPAPPPPANTYLPVEVEPRTMSTPTHVIQGPTPLPDEPEEKHGYVYPHPNPVFHPETTMQPPETTTPEPTEAPATPAPPPPNVVGGYQPLFLIPFFPAQSGFQYYGGLLPQPNIGYLPPAPVVQNGGEGVVINIPSKTYLPPKS